MTRPSLKRASGGLSVGKAAVPAASGLSASGSSEKDDAPILHEERRCAAGRSPSRTPNRCSGCSSRRRRRDRSRPSRPYRRWARRRRRARRASCRSSRLRGRDARLVSTLAGSSRRRSKSVTIRLRAAKARFVASINPCTCAKLSALSTPRRSNKARIISEASPCVGGGALKRRPGAISTLNGARSTAR